MALVSPCRAFPARLSSIVILLSAQTQQAHTVHTQIPLRFPHLGFLPHILSTSPTVWLFLLFIEEGFALAQKTKGETDTLVALIKK